MRPLIGITTDLERARWGKWDMQVDLLPATYSDAVARAGGAPVLIPLRAGLDGGLARRLDGLILSGGPDIAAERYGAEPHEAMREIRYERDEAELGLLREFLSTGRPIVAICRGTQLLNVFRGGTLVQHLPEILSGANHHGPEQRPLVHEVALQPASRIAAILGPRVQARCNHHQAVQRAGTGVRVVGHANDGVIEAIELDDHPFAIGVQWHPETSHDGRLFEALVAAAG